MFFTKSVDNIIADITSKIEQLHLVADLKAREAEVHDAVVAERNKLAADARNEYARAKVIAGRLASLVSI